MPPFLLYDLFILSLWFYKRIEPHANLNKTYKYVTLSLAIFWLHKFGPGDCVNNGGTRSFCLLTMLNHPLWACICEPKRKPTMSCVFFACLVAGERPLQKKTLRLIGGNPQTGHWFRYPYWYSSFGTWLKQIWNHQHGGIIPCQWYGSLAVWCYQFLNSLIYII